MYSKGIKVRMVVGLALLLLTVCSIYPVAADPTMPMFLKKKKAKPKSIVVVKPTHKILVVTSTLIAQKRSIAIINDKAVAVGDEVDAAVVIDISSATVTLRRSGKLVTLYLNQKNIKRQPRQQPISSGREGN